MLVCSYLTYIFYTFCNVKNYIITSCNAVDFFYYKQMSKWWHYVNLFVEYGREGQDLGSGTDVQTFDVLKTSSFSCWWFCDSITAVKRHLSNKVKPYGFTINETFYLSSAMFKFDWYHSYYSWQQTFEMKMCTYKQYSAVCFHLHWSGSRPLIIHN